MNSKNRSKSAFLNMIFNLTYQIVNTVVNIILPPLIISKFGSIINGLISTIKQILGYVQLVGSGISESTVVSLYKPLAKNDEKKISAIFNACSETFFKMGILFSVGAVIIALVYPFFIKEGINYFFLVMLILVLSVAGASEFFVIGKCRSLLIADQKIYIVNIAQIFGAIANLVITILLIKMDANIVIVQLGSSLMYVARLIIVYSYVKKNYTFLNNKILPDYSAISKRKAATVHQLSGLISFGSQTIVVSMFCGLAEASIYSVYNLVFTGINTILSTVSSALLATFGDIIANEDKEKLNSLFSTYETVYYILVFLLYTITYILFLSFVDLYTSGADINYHRPEYAFLFCLMGIVNCLRTPGATLINAIGHYHETQNRALIEMSICFILELLLVNFIGASGVLIATITAYLYRTSDVVYYSNHIILNKNIKQSIFKIFVNLTICIFLVLLFQFVSISATSYLLWLKYAVIIGIFSTFIFLSVNFLFQRKEFVRIRGMIKK
ncbi:MAG: hypothetical protein Q4Q31_07300 [Bacillota bacterium]|nr:hypothetical protein [Bacillota bacterium]